MLSQLEQKIADRFQRRHCVFVGSATTALTLLFRALGLSETRRVLFPGVSCLVAYSSALYAGATPRFADIRIKDCTIDPVDLERALQSDPAIRVIVPTHLYGHLYDIEAIARIAEKYGVMVIEDAAQAMGATYNGQAAGSFGLASVVSFGHTKIIEAGHGGAVLTNDAGLAKDVRRLACELISSGHSADQREQRQTDYRKAYYEAVQNGMAWDPESPDNLLQLQLKYKDSFIIPFDSFYKYRIESLMETLDNEVETRNRKAELYEKSIQKNEIVKCQIGEGSVRWRYSFRIQADLRDNLLAHLRSQQIHCSSWYPFYPRLFGETGLPQSQLWEQEVVNLWVDSTYYDVDIERICGIIQEWAPENRRRDS